MAGIRVGSRVRLANTKGLSGYGFYRRIKRKKSYIVRAIKRSGGLLLEGFVVGYSILTDEEQGIMKDRFVLVKKRKKKTATKRKKK